MKAEILILGVLHRGNLHPYEIKRRLTNAFIQCFTDVDVGTLYYAVRQLSKKQLIAPVSRQRVLRGGIKTVYRITTLGKQRFQQLLHEQFESPGTVAQTLYIPMLFLHLCDRTRVASLLGDRVAQQMAAIEELSAVRKELSPKLGTGALHLLRHLKLQRELDLGWLQELHAKVAADRVYDSPVYAEKRVRGLRR